MQGGPSNASPPSRNRSPNRSASNFSGVATPPGRNNYQQAPMRQGMGFNGLSGSNNMELRHVQSQGGTNYAAA